MEGEINGTSEDEHGEVLMFGTYQQETLTTNDFHIKGD